ncbi:MULTISPECIES: isopropylmalate synthase [Streptomyces]|uniref:isopropylmalate synthase n=1 Tax=Streptomyces TaxID=1883 RepID=UPI00103B5120|nr:MULTISPECIES: isopropylmalate synthase [Streptomyces]MBT3077129.1 isopropylmalate synthase [Streptomyces sp. COG21]MBT3082444.1 isopropylmalate synthase [Streptomyces sp. COG20]MBT3088367.1 isopropylmalate synthase [Streptomyces sp. CYG21]MBT3100680.1 isopropylmalate synthase [Streptomyces sp. CBG30]MBT3104417.1 isopropylmalate synthase [Streptomyces sp. COG19]
MTAEGPEKLERPPRISDATLRDSAHMAGVEFGPADAAAIADLLVRTGVELVEVGMVSGPDSKDADLVLATHEAVTPERSMTLLVVRDRRQVARALDEAERLGVRHIMYSIPTSEQHAQLKLDSASPKFLQTLARSAITQAKERGFHVTFSGEDGARTPRERLVPYVEAGFAAGADRFRLAETVAYLSPWQMQEVIADLTAIDGSEIEIHSHNMLGLAVANSLAAVRAGAQWISATVGGIGERGGNAPLAELLTALRVIHGDTRFDLTHLTELSRIALRGAGLGEAFQSGPTTPHAFAYELPGQLSHPHAYETLPAELVGNQRELRVRTRLTTALVRWALADAAQDVDVDAFTAWLAERQERDGRPLLDRDTIREAAVDFRPVPA